MTRLSCMRSRYDVIRSSEWLPIKRDSCKFRARGKKNTFHGLEVIVSYRERDHMQDSVSRGPLAFVFSVTTTIIVTCIDSH